MFDYMENLLCGKDMNGDSNVKMSCWKNYTTTAIADQTKTSEVVYHLVESMKYIDFKASLLLYLFLIIF